MIYIFALLLIVIGVAIGTFFVLRNNKKTVDKVDKIVDVLKE